MKKAEVNALNYEIETTYLDHDKNKMIWEKVQIIHIKQKLENKILNKRETKLKLTTKW